MRNCVILLLGLGLLYIVIQKTEATTCCPPSDTIMSKYNCSNGSEITTISCKQRDFMFATLDRPLLYEIGEDDVLIVTRDEDLGFIVMNPDQYCVGLSAENESDLIIICMHDDETKLNETISVKWQILGYVRMICALVSVFSFGLIAFIYIYLPELQDIEGKCIINFSISLAICHFLQCIAPIIIVNYEDTCDIFSFMNNYVLLCGYNWLTVMSIHMWRITMQPVFRRQMNWFLIYMCYGYGLPTILLITSLISHLTNKMELEKRIEVQMENDECSLENSVIVWFYFYAPLAILVLISTVVQLWAAKVLWIDIYRKDNPSVVYLRKKSHMYLHALIVMGCLTVVELSLYPLQSSNKDEMQLALYIIDCRNLLIGASVFFVFVLLRNKVRKALAKKGLCCITFPDHWKKLIDEEIHERDRENDETRLTTMDTRF
ncbi:hypothetical protein PPYR_00722 [Photinus pyralis]|uniref:G-protein coupled receptors family 2 profile 2 domain-containing protein n=3 Tax=Photinus pyralis TaxID=7054 RepID=A0A1Y1MTS7_PHOPY|nr:G-protein coupled receptor Mth2-like [Photinus pyralis]XP_031341354.1 G-protein coupled receptor Mth2-like [Photinus pyralis]XP_031341361.1 G-protein coupled receptor Mth2-like [Photinus pyralis]KAB0803752.1 hypothetical protein PPYR_00722 [Photinus pyralis]